MKHKELAKSRALFYFAYEVLKSNGLLQFAIEFSKLKALIDFVMLHSYLLCPVAKSIGGICSECYDDQC